MTLARSRRAAWKLAVFAVAACAGRSAGTPRLDPIESKDLLSYDWITFSERAACAAFSGRPDLGLLVTGKDGEWWQVAALESADIAVDRALSVDGKDSVLVAFDRMASRTYVIRPSCSRTHLRDVDVKEVHDTFDSKLVGMHGDDGLLPLFLASRLVGLVACANRGVHGVCLVDRTREPSWLGSFAADDVGEDAPSGPMSITVPGLGPYDARDFVGLSSPAAVVTLTTVRGLLEELSALQVYRTPDGEVRLRPIPIPVSLRQDSLDRVGEARCRFRAIKVVGVSDTVAIAAHCFDLIDNSGIRYVRVSLLSLGHSGELAVAPQFASWDTEFESSDATMPPMFDLSLHPTMRILPTDSGLWVAATSAWVRQRLFVAFADYGHASVPPVAIEVAVEGPVSISVTQPDGRILVVTDLGGSRYFDRNGPLDAAGFDGGKR